MGRDRRRVIAPLLLNIIVFELQSVFFSKLCDEPQQQNTPFSDSRGLSNPRP